jgi:signal transduction histidine kinase/CheY-like chemotaxis protein
MLRPAPGYNSSLSALFAPPQHAGEDDERLARLKRLQFESLANHAKRLPWMVPLACGFVGFTVWNAVPAALILGWIALISAILSVRWEFSRRSLARAELDVDAALRTMAVFSFFNGLVMGGGAALFFGGISLEQKAIVTMIVVSICAAAVSANAGYSRSFYAWALPTFAALAAAWASQGDVAGAWVGFLLLLFPLLQGVFISENERVMRESFEIRYHNERLIRELEVQRQAVGRERDRAEEANRAKSRFLASASHDLRQPLHTLALYSAALRVRKTDERTQEMAREIGNAIASLGTLLDALLDISKLDAGAFKPETRPFALKPLFDSLATAFAPVAARRGVELTVVATRAFVSTDPAFLRRILQNLLSNALRYGRVEGRPQRVLIGCRKEGDGLRIEVRDNGPGIADDKQTLIFDEFVRLQPEDEAPREERGLGLGLAIVDRIARMLELPIALRSAPDRGSTFAVTVPRVPAVVAAPIAPAAMHIAPALETEAFVLCIDNEARVREAMATLLSGWGCRVATAATHAEALAAVTEAGRLPDLVLADLHLDEGPDGLEVVAALRRGWGHAVPAALVTADRDPTLRMRARASQVELLHKPVKPAALRALLRMRGQAAVAAPPRRASMN